MIRSRHLLICLLVLLVTTVSCLKDQDLHRTPTTPDLPPQPRLYKSETFFTRPWVGTGNGFEIQLRPQRLTPDAIAKGYAVLIALDGADIGPWEFLPATIRGVELTVTAEPNFLSVKARTPFDLSRAGGSDIEIRYY